MPRLKHLLPLAIALSFFLFANTYNSQQIGALNSTQQQANLTLANATAYVNTINQSAYLIFYPNLAQAYSYLKRASQLYIRSPSASILYSNQAVSAASQEYSRINYYRRTALIAMLFLSVAVAYILYKSMKPIDKKNLARYKKFSS